MLPDLLGAVSVTLQEGNDLALERIELAGAFGTLARLVYSARSQIELWHDWP